MKKNILIITFFCIFSFPVSAGELLLKVDPGGPEDGRIIAAINDRRISDVHMQHICHKKNFGFKEDGRRESGTLLEVMLEKTREYKFERINKTQIRRTNLWTQEVDIIGPEANENGEYMDVPLYVERRLRHDKHLIFGEQGAEYWYGGGTQNTQAKIDEVWTEIESRTAHRKVNYQEWPFTAREKQAFLPVKVEDFTDKRSNELVHGVVDEQTGEVTQGKDGFRVEYWNNPNFTQQELDQIRNKRSAFDGRSKPVTFTEADIKEIK